MDLIEELEKVGLKIRLAKRKKCKTSQFSYFISFGFNQTIIAKIKELPIRYWIPELQEWEIPDRDLEDLYSLFFPKTATNLQPYESKTHMFPHQMEALEYGLQHISYINSGEPGVGKTKESLDTACYRKKYEGLKHVLVVCGVSNLRANWINEIKKHTNESVCLLGEAFRKEYKTKPGKFYPATIEQRLEHLKSVPEEFFWICNQETIRTSLGKRAVKKRRKEIAKLKEEMTEEELSKKLTRYDKLIAKEIEPSILLDNLYKSGELGLIIIDEVHELRNPKNQATRTLLELPFEIPKILLSGTLIVNSPCDSYVPLKLLGVEDRDFYGFKSYYTNYSLNFGQYVPDGTFRNLDQLQEKLGKYMLRQKKDVLDLPPKIYEEILLEMSDEEEKIYDKVLNNLADDLDKIVLGGGGTNSLTTLIRLRQITSDIGTISTKCDKSTKLEYLRQLIREHIKNGKKMIVYSAFKKVIHRILDYFKDDEIIKNYLDNFIIIEGGMQQDDLEEKKARYQEEEGFACILGVTSALKAGHTLSACNTVVFIDTPFNRATMEQAIDRAHRISTTHSVLILNLLFKDTIDEVIYLTCMNRGYTANHIVDKQKRLLALCIQDVVNFRTSLDDDLGG